MNKQKLIVGVAVAVSLILSLIAVSRPGTVTQTVREIVGSAGSEYNSAVSFNAGATINREIPTTRATTTSTGTSATLVAGDFSRTQTHLVTLGGADEANFTYTLPATSTLSNFIPEVGSRATTCFFNIASSTSDHDLIVAAGTGWDLKIATTTIPVPLGVGDGDQFCINSQRLPTVSGTAGNIVGVLEFYTNAD